MEMLRITKGRIRDVSSLLPFSCGDVTAGTETELQAAVIGKRSDVDLPLTIEQSNYFHNIVRRAATGDASRRTIERLERLLSGNTEQVWENSWVRLPISVLSPFAQEILGRDLLADRSRPTGLRRSDVDKFTYKQNGEQWLRIPVSYLIKIALADAVTSTKGVPKVIRDTGFRLLNHFLSDNTSPETFSFQVVLLSPNERMGKAIARETSKRFLLTQLLVMYANQKFLLRTSGQKAVVYFSPHPPTRQKRLNDCISDSFYRELFMSPCLSGWDKGEEKQEYMHLCHQVLSRSHLNVVAKLRDAGIIVNNLVVLPNTSNISLANNGTHISMGSRKLTELRRDEASGFTSAHEKYLGDLVVKVVEHFLPLFVGSYSAAPYRIDFVDFHPEKVLGFLPHELDYTHLRMLWRRWKKKASIKCMGRPITPFGPEWFDRALGFLFQLRGDYIADFRLIDYLVCLMSTDRSPALDGTSDSSERLKKDLGALGIFDPRMSLYLLYKLRAFDVMGFCGFEGRHYSLFESLGQDLGKAADLQALVTALAFKYIAEGKVTHSDIPDSPFLESERRQVIFDAAIGIPTFFVRGDTQNQFLKTILERTAKVRMSHRYPGYLRVYTAEYRKALWELIARDGLDLIEMMELEETMLDLKNRIEQPDELSAAGRLTRGILADAGHRSPLSVRADEFNLAAEKFYRDKLRKKHIEEAISFLEDDILKLEQYADTNESLREALRTINGGNKVVEYLRSMKVRVLDESLTSEELRNLIHVILITVSVDRKHYDAMIRRPWEKDDTPSIPRAGNA